MALGDILAELFGRGNNSPIDAMKKKILVAQAGGPTANDASPPGPDPNQPPTPPPKPVVEDAAAKQPIVNPQPDPVPNAYKTPPDLSSMYMEYMDKVRRQQNTSDAMTMIAAGLTPREEVRTKLLGTIGQNGSSSDLSSGMFNVIEKTREAQQKAEQQARLRGLLPVLSKQLGIPQEQLDAMLVGGQLEEFIKEASKPDNQIITNPDGSQSLVSKKTGQKISDVGPAKPEETVMMDNPDGKGGKIAVIKTKEGDLVRVDPDHEGEPYSSVEAKHEIKYIDQPNGRKLATDESGNRLPEKDIPAVHELDIQKGADGRFQAIDKVTGKPVGDPFGATTPDKTDDMKNYAAEKAAAVARGETFPDYDKWREKKSVLASPQGGANWDPRTGTNVGDPEKGHQWKRDKNGHIMTDESGQFIQVVTPGTDEAAKAAEADKAAARKKGQQIISSGIVVNDANRALEIAEENKGSWFTGTTGLAGVIGSAIPGTPAHAVFQKLQSVKAEIGFDRLQQMRDNSPTGAALGPVSDFENRLLQATYGSLEQSNTYEDFKSNLERVKEIYAAIVNDGIGSTPDEINASPLAKKLGISMDKDGTVSYKTKEGGDKPPAGAKVRRYNKQTKKFESVESP